MEYQFKQQTPEHKATMAVMLKMLLAEGYTKDDIIDCGDYILDQMTVEELTGAKSNDKQRGNKKAAKGKDKPVKGDKAGAGSKPEAKPEKPAKAGADKGKQKGGKEGSKESGKAKGKAGKGKSGKSKKL